MAEPMNILVLMGDHHRFDAMSCLGNPLARTPNLDRLAARSVRFENCFTQSPVCAPARHSLATGRYAHAQGVINNSYQPHPGMSTIAHALQPLDYRRLQFGHMHWTDPEMDTGYEPWDRVGEWRDSLPKKLEARRQWEGENITRRGTGGPSPRSREQYAGHHVSRRVVEAIEASVEQEEHFLCWVGFSEPHPPFYPPSDIYRSFDLAAIELPRQAPAGAAPPHDSIISKRREWEHLTEVELRQIIAGYYGMVQLLDGYVGTVLDALDRLGIREQTIVVWTSDHGDQMWEHELFLKFNMHEASVRVPFMIDVPGGAPGVRSELVEHIDLFPTLCDLVGAACPDSVQGRSLRGLLDGQETPEDWREAVFSQIGSTRMVRTADWKLNDYDGEPGELYDLRDDPEEFHNRIDDPDCADTAAALHDRMLAWAEANRPLTER